MTTIIHRCSLFVCAVLFPCIARGTLAIVPSLTSSLDSWSPPLSPMSNSALSNPAPSLSQAYAAAQANLQAINRPPPSSTADGLTSLYTRTLDSLQQLLSLQSSAISSSSDFLSDLPTSSLRYLFTHFYIAQTLSGFPGIDGRLARVRQSITAHLSFLGLCDSLDALTKAEEKRYREVKRTVEGQPSDEDERRSSASILDAGQARLEKIARYKEQKALEARLAAYEDLTAQRKRKGKGKQPSSADDADDGDEEEAEREYWMSKLRLCVMKALDEALLSHQELAFLRERDARAADPSPSPSAPAPAAPHTPVVYHIASPSELSQPIPAHMAQYLHPLAGAVRPGRAAVFRDPNPATVSIEEWADGEIAEGRLPGPVVERRALTREERGYVGRPEDREEDERKAREEDADDAGEWGGEGEERVSEAKAKESRDWDNWKDDHEKGSGNRMGRR